MECTLCCEQFNDQNRIPRNLQCGHTYCEFCIIKIFQTGTNRNCPSCRVQFNFKRAQDLPKNYIALQLVQQAKQNQKFNCQKHPKEDLRLYCSTCSMQICVECILEHSGHNFVKLEEAKDILIESTKKIASQIDQYQTKLINKIAEYHSTIQIIDQKASKDINKIVSEFEKIHVMIENRMKTLIDNYNNSLKQEKLKAMEQIQKFKIQEEEISKINENVNKFLEEILQIKDASIKNKKQIETLKKYEDQFQNVQREQKVFEQKVYFNIPFFDIKSQDLENIINEIGEIIYSSDLQLKDVSNPMVCYFGDRSKLMIFDIKAQKWRTKQINIPNFEFNFYSAAVSLLDGSALITGGGCSNQVYRFWLENQTPIIKSCAQMSQFRKEHAAVYINNFVYVIGGYDGVNSKFLKQCEKYNVEQDFWSPCASLNTPACAFAATQLNNRFIYIFGGYDGHSRLSSIEQYDPQEDI